MSICSSSATALVRSTRSVYRRSSVGTAVRIWRSPRNRRREVRRRFRGERQILTAVPTELLRYTERVERTKAVAELEQMLIVDREQRPLQRGEGGQLVIGPFDGGERRSNGLDLLASVERL